MANQNKKSKASELEVARAVEEMAKKRQLDEAVKEEEKELVFTATTEFVRGINTAEEDEISHRIVVEKKESGEAMEIEQDTHQEKSVDEEKTSKDSQILEKEAMVGKGVGSALEFLKQRGGLNAMNVETFSGRATDKPLNIDQSSDKIRLEYLDDEGNRMTPKEAFRHLSHRFHGKMPSKNKQEKRMKKKQEILKQKYTSSIDAATLSVQAMVKTQQERKSPYLVIQGGNTQKLMSDLESSEFKEIRLEKQLPKKNEKKAGKVQFELRKK
eukprot:TRINITY_DN4497_c0_g3_i2.p1 TRINITY_DN4497_c0_g3~~TRINITY_DN4497_c0_g3_i2.p1  ORF type:complete len:270 (+),score=69.27 TRINITY_DN4497_c0_g3_i2:158-967(+)